LRINAALNDELLHEGLKSFYLQMGKFSSQVFNRSQKNGHKKKENGNGQQ